MSASANVEVNAKDCVAEDPVKLAAFEKHVAQGGLIEPNDWMPLAYKSLMLRMAEHHANSEIVGALPEGSHAHQVCFANLHSQQKYKTKLATVKCCMKSPKI